MVTQAIPRFILAFATILIGIVLINVISIQGLSVTTVTPVEGESISIASAVLNAAGNLNNTRVFTPTNVPTDWRTDTSNPECQPGSGVNPWKLKNASGTTFTVTTDYVVGNLGTFTIQNSSKMQAQVISSNTTLVSYAYCPSGYVTSGFGRTSIQLIGGFFALALLGVGLALFYSLAREFDLV